MPEINEKLFIEIYNQGKSDVELSDLFGVAERSIQRYGARLRRQGKIKLRKDLETVLKEKVRHPHKEVFEEVETYLSNAKKIYEPYNDLFQHIKLKTTWGKHKQTEDLAALFSDMHTGMINKHPLTGDVTYNEELQEEELKAYLRGIFRFYQLYKPSYNLETLHVFDAGDNITNDRIYDGQQAEIVCGVGQQIVKCFEYKSQIIRRCLEIFPRIVWRTVPGNHGRTTSKYISEDATNSFEYLLGIMLKERFQNNKKVEIIVPGSYNYTATIYEHKYFLTHGNTVRGATLNSIERAVKDIATLAHREFYDAVLIGHFHTALKLRITPETNLLVNGCWIDYDDYAYHKLHKFSSATQYLFNISKKSPMHNVQEINLLWK